MQYNLAGNLYQMTSCNPFISILFITKKIASVPRSSNFWNWNYLGFTMASKVLSSPIQSAISPKKLDKDSVAKIPKITKNLLLDFGTNEKSENNTKMVSSKENTKPKDTKKKPFTVSVEGNIGSGKSTFLKYFSKFPNVKTHQEPLDLWTDLGGHNLLENLYKDPKRWSFLFQSYVQLTRLGIHLADTECNVKLIERSLQNNRNCFLELGHDKKVLEDAEYIVLSEYFDFLNDNMDIGVDLIVYLRSTPEVVYERMKKRGRQEEAGVPLEYLKDLHSYYEKWLLEKKPNPPPAPVLIIDADLELNKIMSDYESNKLMILGQEPFPFKDQENKENNQNKENEDNSNS